jgi:hypothetical protein
MQVSHKYNLLLSNIEQLYDLDMLSFMVSSGVYSSELKPVEIFDVSQGIVIKKSQSSEKIQKTAYDYLMNISSLYVKVKALPDKGHIIKIPFEEPKLIQNKWINGNVSEVFVILPEQQKPYLLVLDESRRPFFYNFEGNTYELLKSLDFIQGDTHQSIP